MGATHPTFLLILLKLHGHFGHGLKSACGLDYYCHFFCKLNLPTFSGGISSKVNIKWIPCVNKSTYSFMPIILKLHMCFGHGLKMCIWFGYIPQITINVSYRQDLVRAIPPTILPSLRLFL